MGKIINAIFKLRRGMSADWERVNPILESGEPAFELDTLKMKIGNGLTPWNDLPYIDGKREVSNFNYVYDFPVIGDENVIYKAEKEQSLYQFNADTNKYEKLSDGMGIDDINIINGGTA